MKKQKGHKMKKMLHLLAAFVAICVFGGTVRAAENVAQIGEMTYATLQEAITAAGDSATITLADGTYTMPTLANKNITFTGGRGVVIDMSASVNASGSTLTFDGVSLKFGHSSHIGFTHAAKIVYKTCALSDRQTLYAPVAEFTNCVLTHNDSTSVWTYGANDVMFTGCTFMSGGRAVQVYNEATDGNFVADVKFTDCKFYSDGTDGNKTEALVETNRNGGDTATSNKYKLTFTNCSTELTNDDGRAFWGNKGNMDGDHLTVVIDGKTVYPVALSISVAKIGDVVYATLADAITAAGNGATVTLLADIQLAEMLIIAKDKNITLDLNGKAVSVTKSGDRSLYAFDNQGTLTLTDSSAKGAGSITARGVQNHGTMVMNGGTIYTCDTNGGYGVWNYGKFIMNGGKIETTFIGNYQNPTTPTCLRNEDEATATLTGGEIKSANVAVYAIISIGTLEIAPAEGKTVTVYAPRAIAIDDGVATINGGTFETFDARNSGENGTHVAAEIYYPLYVSGGKVTVTDGEFKAPVVAGEPSHSLMISGAEAEVVLKGGTYNQPVRIDNTTMPNLTKAEDVDVLAPEGYEWNEEGKLVVGYQEPVCATVAGVEGKMTLSAALAYANQNAGSVITLDKDATIELANWTSVDVKNAITLDGNGKTITGLTAPLVNNSSADFTVKNLTVSGANIAVTSANGADNDTSAAAIVQWANGGTLTLENVSVTGSTITGDGYVAALVGFVDSTAAGVVVTGGSITGNTLTAGGTVGAVAGHTYADVTVTDVTISGNTLTSTSDGGTRPDKVGLVVGRLSADTVSISATVKIDNEAKNGDTVINGTVVGSIPGGTAVITGGTYSVDPTVTGKDGQTTAVKEGFEIVETDGSYVLQRRMVAQVGTAKYATLQEAIDAATAESNGIILIADVTETDITVAADDDVIIDLNGKTVTGDFMVKGKATIKDGTINSTVSGRSGIEVNNEADRTLNPTLVVEGLTIVSGRHAIRVDGGTVSIKGGSYTAVDAASNHAVNISDGGKVTIENGTFVGNMQSGTGAVAIRGEASELTISGGTFTGGSEGSLTVWAGTATVTGGTFDSVYGDVAIAISGGTFGKVNKLTGTAVTGGTFGADVTTYCAEGYWAFQKYAGVPSAIKDVFYVAKKAEAPNAIVTIIDNPTVDVAGVGDVTLESTYKFVAPDLTEEDAVESQYSAWHADFVVSVDKDIPAKSIVLAGNYGTYDWISFTNPDSVKAGTEIRLLKDVGNGSMTYYELCALVKEFSCGVADIEDKLAGVTFTVELRMYQTEPVTSGNGSVNNEVEGATPITVATVDGEGNPVSTSYTLGANDYTVTLVVNGNGTAIFEGREGTTCKVIRGESVTITATPNADYSFVGWSASDGSASTLEKLEFEPTGNVTINATFVPTALYTSMTNAVIVTYKNENELVSVSEIQNMSVQNPTIEVKDGTATVGIQLMDATTLKGEKGEPNWEVVPLQGVNTFVDGNTIKVSLPAEGSMRFFRFIPVNGLQSAD